MNSEDLTPQPPLPRGEGEQEAGEKASRLPSARSSSPLSPRERGAGGVRCSEDLTPQPPLPRGEGEQEAHRIATPSHQPVLLPPLPAGEGGRGGEVFARPLVVGVLGGIGAGKSEAAAALAARAGGRVVVADTLGHEALRVPEIRDALVAKFGDSILSGGEIDRKRLASVVFADKSALAYLGSLTHPWIRRRFDDEARRAHEDRVPLLVIDAALLLEAGWEGACDRLVFVDATPEVRGDRLRHKRGWSAEDAQRRESAQLPLTRKRSVADHIIDNSSSHESLVRQVDDLLECWGLRREPAPPPGGAHDAV